MSVTVVRAWPAFFPALTEEVPDGQAIHEAINDIIAGNFVVDILCVQTGTGPSTGNCNITTDVAVSGGEQTAIDAFLALHTGVVVGGGPEDLVYVVPTSVKLGDFVYSTGALAADRADNGSQATIPTLGIVVAKPTTTTARIVSEGEVDGLSGMTPGADQFLGTAGARIEAGSLPSAPGSVVQQLGVAVSATTILLGLRQVIVL